MAKKDYTQEIATALRAGFVYSLSAMLPDPDIILAKIGRHHEVYQQILTDSKVCACVEQRKAGCLAMLWDVQGDDGNAKAVEIIKQALQRLDMPQIISSILDAALWGYQPLEVMWEVVNGLTLPADVIAKPSHWFGFTANNELRFLSATEPYYGEGLKPRKFLLAQHHKEYTNPYGEKILPKCFWPVTFKKGAWKWWVSATEKFGSPFIVGKVPRGTDGAEIDQLNEELQALVQDVTAVLPNDTAIEIMDGQSGRSSGSGSPHRELIEQCNAEIALAILGQTLTTEVGSSGSYAASKTHNDVREDIIAGDKRMVEKTIQKLIEWICELNWPGLVPPKFSMWDEEDVDKEQAERDKILTETGVKFTKTYYIKAYGLAEDDFEITENSQGAEFAEAPLKPRLTKVKRQFNAEDYQLDGAKLSEFGKAIVGPIVKLISEGKSYEEVREKLERAYPQLGTDDLEEALARAFYVAAIEGNLNG